MMLSLRKNIVALLFLIPLLTGLFYLIQSNTRELSEEEIITLLKTHPDALEYLNQNPNYEITNKTLLTEESILAGQNATTFWEIYQDLALEDNRYLKVDMFDNQTNRGLFVVIDIQNKTVVKVYGLILVGM